ncbi:hypothetical protein [Bacillus thuringiensis]|uniref:hypothetical protein n=1 Tax=Bacillus thuringiensis TaxID=1428 RepID=UPI0037FCAB74
MRFVKYLLETEYTLKRSNDSVVKSWGLNDKNTIHSVSYFQKDPDSENKNVIGKISDIETINGF